MLSDVPRAAAHITPRPNEPSPCELSQGRGVPTKPTGPDSAPVSRDHEIWILPMDVEIGHAMRSALAGEFAALPWRPSSMMSTRAMRASSAIEMAAPRVIRPAPCLQPVAREASACSASSTASARAGRRQNAPTSDDGCRRVLTGPRSSKPTWSPWQSQPGSVERANNSRYGPG
jgi:hypothetical protein